MNGWLYMACNLDIHTQTHYYQYHFPHFICGFTMSTCTYIRMTESILSLSYLLNKYQTFTNLGMNTNI
jgi:hypothetical protein